MEVKAVERSRLAIRWSKVLLGVLLAALSFVLLLLGAGQFARAKPSAQQGENLVANGGFEEPEPASWENSGSHGWQWWFFWSGSVSHGGDHSAGIGSNLNGYKGYWWSDPFAVEAGQHYDFSGWVQASNLSEAAFLTLAFFSSPSDDRPIEEFYSSQVTGSGDWIQVTGSAVAPIEGHYARVLCELRGRGTVWFDDVLARQIPVQKPILAISKGDGSDPVMPGQSLVYTIGYSNTGNVGATQVVITDTYDANVSFESAYPSPEPGSENRVWQIGALGPQARGSIVITVTVNSPLPDGLTLHNLAEMGCSETDPVSATTTTRVTSRPDLAISKSDDPDPVEPGGSLVYRIAYSNTGTAFAAGVVVTDTLPAQVSYQSASVPPTGVMSDSHVLIWENLGDLDVGDDGTIVVTTTVDGSAPRGAYLCNQIRIGCDDAMPEGGEACTTIRPELISIAPPSASGSAPPGQEACYDHTVYLTGTQAYAATLTAVSSHGWATRSSPSPLSLAPQQPKPITACVSVPAGSLAISGTVDVLTVTVSLVGGPGDTVTSRDATTVERILPEIPVTPVGSSAVNCSGQYPQGFAFAHSITNAGNYTDEFELEIVADCCPGGCPSEIARVVPASQIVGAGDTFAATLHLTATAERPTCWAQVEVRSQAFPQTYTAFLDEVGMPLSRVSIEPDVVKEVTGLPGVPTTVTLAHTLTNKGNCPDGITVSAHCSDGDWTAECASPAPLGPGASAPVTLAVTTAASPGSNATATVVITAVSGLDPSEKDTAVDRITFRVDQRPNKAYLPLTMRNYRPLCNGGFETGDLTCWAGGGALKRSVQAGTAYAGTYAALLGDPAYTCRGGVPVGEAWIGQTVSVPACANPTLSFRYRIRSNDKLSGDKWDSFDVYVNDTLVLRDGNTAWALASCDRAAWDSGWRDFTYDLGAHGGRNVQISFRNVSRKDQYYNTWTYLDQVQLTCPP